MFIGHYAPALVAAAHPRAPRLPVLFVAAQLVDIAFFGFVLAGVEHMRLVPGFTRVSALDLHDMPLTHSLLGTLGWAALTAIGVRLLTRDWTAAWLTGAVVASHWLLDLLVHAPDLTLFGAPPKLGLGLWNYPALEMPIELALAFTALVFFAERRPSATRGGDWMLAGLAAAMTLLQLADWLGPRPARTVDPVPVSLPLTALAAFAGLTALAWGVARTRRA
jgi:hypothetical protein